MSFNPQYKATPDTLLEGQRTTGVVDSAGRLLVSTGGAGGGSITVTPAALKAGTSRSGTITTGGTAQTLAAANTSRTILAVQNISAGDLWINEDGSAAVVNTAGSYKLVPNATAYVQTNEAVSIIGATTGQAFTATEVS